EKREEQTLDTLRAKPSFAQQTFVEVLAFDKTHHHVGSAVLFQEVVNADDSRGAVKPGKGACLVEEALAAPRKLVGMVWGSWQDGSAAAANSQIGWQVLLDSHI